MERGKRASMREGPLAALFRKTEEEGLEEPLRKDEKREEKPAPPSEPDRRAQQTPAARRVEEPARVEPQIRTPEERLRTVFSSDIPDNMLEKPEPAPMPRYGTEPPVGHENNPLLRAGCCRTPGVLD